MIIILLNFFIIDNIDSYQINDMIGLTDSFQGTDSTDLELPINSETRARSDYNFIITCDNNSHITSGGDTTGYYIEVNNTGTSQDSISLSYDIIEVTGGEEPTPNDWEGKGRDDSSNRDSLAVSRLLDAVELRGDGRATVVSEVIARIYGCNSRPPSVAMDVVEGVCGPHPLLEPGCCPLVVGDSSRSGLAQTIRKVVSILRLCGVRFCDACL